MDIPKSIERPLQKFTAQRVVIMAGSVVGLTIMGDSLMYNILPLEASHLGIPVALVGVLLSANRIVRLLSNTWVSRSFERYGPRLPFLFSALLGLMTTVAYGLGWGFVVFLLARIGWGIAWSGLRQGGYQAVWVGHEVHRGRLMGAFWGTVRVGSATSVLLGGYLHDRFGFQTAVFAIAGLSALALPVAFALRWPRDEVVVSSIERQRSVVLNTPQQRWLLAAGFVHSALEGVLTATVSTFLAGRLGAGQQVGVATVAGLLLAVRWFSGLVVGPVLGWVSDRLGRPLTALLLTMLMLVSLVGTIQLAQGWVVVSISLVFVSGAGLFVVLSTAANNLAAQNTRPHRFVGAFTTAADAGLALGPVLAFSLGNSLGFDLIYLTAAVALLVVVVGYRGSARQIQLDSGNPHG